MGGESYKNVKIITFLGSEYFFRFYLGKSKESWTDVQTPEYL